MSAAFRLFVPDDGPDELTVPDIVARYLAALQKRVDADDFSGPHLKDKRRYLGWFSKEFPLRISECRQQDLLAWVERHPTWKSAHVKKSVVGHVVSCFAWAADPERGGLIERSPYKTVRAISKLPYVPRRPATTAEYIALMRAGCVQFRKALLFLYHTGTRPYEMRDLTFEHLRLDGESPHLYYARHKTFRQTGKPKIVGLSDLMVRLLKYLVAHRRPRTPERPEQTHVFLNTDGNPWIKRTFEHHLDNVRIRARLDKGVNKAVSAGCLRTTFACDGIKSGYTNREVADALGHESTFMVDHVYGAATRQESERQADLAKKMAQDRKSLR